MDVMKMQCVQTLTALMRVHVTTDILAMEDNAKVRILYAYERSIRLEGKATIMAPKCEPSRK